MARVSSFVLLVVLLFLVENERSSGLPTKIQSNNFEFEEEGGGLNPDERAHIRQILMLAAKELRDEDIIQILKNSLVLRLKICFSLPLPSLPPHGLGRPGKMNDNGLSTTQKQKLRKILQEALEYIDEENILNFLKSSLYFRLMFCLRTPLSLKTPLPEPSQSPGGHANKTTPSQGPDAKPPTEEPDTNWPTDFASTSSNPTEASGETNTTSKAGESAPEEEKEHTQNDMPDLPEFVLQNAIPSISGWNEIPQGPDIGDLPREVSSRLDLAAESAELEGLKNRHDPEKASWMESIPHNSEFTKLSESLPNGKESTMTEESDKWNDRAVGTTLDGVGKAALPPEESLKANSDNGEFRSVIMIDYDALTDKEEKIATGGVNLTPTVPDEQLSL